MTKAAACVTKISTIIITAINIYMVPERVQNVSQGFTKSALFSCPFLQKRKLGFSAIS
jgi:hypothetical protein